MRYRAIAQHHGIHSVERLCRALQVSRSGYYAWRQRPESDRTRRHRALIRQIGEFFTASDRTYGARRIRDDLREAGEVVGRHTVALLMRRAQLVPKTVKRFRITTDSRKTTPAPNLLAQQFNASRPNERWVSDVTFIPTRQGWLYLAVMMDLFSRAVVGWSMSHRLTRALVVEALTMAIARRTPDRPLIVHSDQGSQYASADYRQLLQAHGLTASMSRKGHCWDNAAMESFFHTLKTERVHHEDYRTRSEARCSIFQYIEVFYNQRRRHSYLNNQAPIRFELNYANHP